MMKRRGIGYLLFAVAFVLGVVAGGAAMFAWSQESHASIVRDGEVFEKHRLRALSRKLDLDRDQETRVANILASDGQESRVIGHEVVERCGERLRDHRKRVDDEIRGVLHTEQQRRFDRIIDERHHPAGPGRFR